MEILCQLKSDLNPDALTWSADDHGETFLISGTYTFDEAIKKRIGSLTTYLLNADGCLKEQFSSKQEFGILSSTLDSERNVLTTTSNGQLAIFAHSQLEAPLQKLAVHPDGLLLWADLELTTNKTVCSDSGGNVSVVNNVEFAVENCWKAHDYEAWCCAFDQGNPNLVFSGGDDCLFKQYDLRVNLNPLCTIKSHTAGVTSFCQFESFPDLLFSGSYDNRILTWDKRRLALTVSETDFGGGIWRMRFNSTKPYIAAACMQNGCHIIRADTSGILRSVYHYPAHTLAYDIDWCPRLQVSESDFLISSCSFYEKQIHVWKWNGREGQGGEC